MARRLLFALVLVVLFTSCADAPRTHRPAQASPSDQILFDGEGEGHEGEKHDLAIFTMNPDGTDVTRLSSPEISATSPAWTLDHMAIAFQSDYQDPGNYDIYVMNADGTDLRRVTTDPAIESGPAWAPDGKRIVFERSDPEGHIDLYIVDVDSLEETRLTDAKAGTAQPSWSPDGQSIAFARNVEGGINIYSIDVESGLETQLTAGDLTDKEPAWSPDGSQIAFTRNTTGGRSQDIWLMNADGSDPYPFIETSRSEFSPSWSPDGKQLIAISWKPVEADATRAEIESAIADRDFVPRVDVVAVDAGTASDLRTIPDVVPLWTVSW